MLKWSNWRHIPLEGSNSQEVVTPNELYKQLWGK